VAEAGVSSESVAGLNRSGWDEAIGLLASPPPLLQSYGYGEVQRNEGWRVERLVLAGGPRALVLLAGAGRLATAYVPRGPVPPSPEAIDELASWAQDRRLARLRVEPEATPDIVPELVRRGFKPAPAMHPTTTLVVPLGTEDEMLASFKPKHRYNVKLARKRGIQVEEGSDARELLRHARATGRRQAISVPSLRHFQERLDRLGDCRTYVALYEGRPLAAIMAARFGGRAYYLFGGSSGERRELMPTYAVQWAAMRSAAAHGCRDYDLWGLPPNPDPGHPWHGLWQFKTGFGGELVTLSGAWELELSPLRARVSDAAARARRAGRRIFTA
jgi:hypothetical protein